MTMGKTMVYVGQWAVPQADGPGADGGISIFELDEDGRRVVYRGHFPLPPRASALTYVPETGTLYAANQMKGAGRGAWRSGSTLWAYRVEPSTGELTELGHIPTMGSNPEAISRIPGRNALVVACTGGNDHVEKIIQRYDGKWETYYEYDDGSVSLLALEDDGTIGDVLDVALHREHGPDPSPAQQHGGRCQIAGHPHSCTVDASGAFVLVGDKGSDRLYVYRIRGAHLDRIHTFWLGDCTGGRHIAFDPSRPTRFYMTTEFSSELLSFDLDVQTGGVSLLDRISTVAPTFASWNEPATLRVHPNGRYIFVNNRGEDSIVTVTADASGKLTRNSAFQLSRSHGDLLNATRQFELSPDSRRLFVAERPANLLRILDIHEDGALSEAAAVPVVNPSSVCFVAL